VVGWHRVCDGVLVSDRGASLAEVQRLLDRCALPQGVGDVVAAQAPVTDLDSSRVSEAPVASRDDAARLGGVAMRLDIAVWRRRPWWWRLAASLVVRRLGR
jgi:hypothetical protein